MGSKGGGSAPAPDPRLVEAQIRSMGIQDSSIKRLLDQSDEMLPLQKEQLQFGLDSARTAYQQSQDDRDWMLTRRGQLSGVQDKIVQDANEFDSDARAAELIRTSNADVDEAFSSARGQGSRALSRRGVNLSSGRALMAMGGMDAAQAVARATAANKVREAARAEGFALTDRANNALAGYPAMGMSATGAGAGFGSAGLGLVNSGLAGMNSGAVQAGQMAGSMGQNATGMYGAQANYQIGMENAAGKSSGGMLSGIGGLIGAGTQFLNSDLGKKAITAIGAFSDPRLKENITRVGTHPETNLGIYEFNYIASPGRRFRGVMADEVERTYPGAVGRDRRGFMTVNYSLLGIPFEEITNG